jgi:peptidoglycan L-alanyl-D-glutamate endopeptidase CwlK
MQVLKEGDSGPDVTSLQNKLQVTGFPPGAPDGNFGPATNAAVIAFQRSEGLVPDGIVGQDTAQALSFDAAVLPPLPAMPAVTVNIVSKMFPGTHLDPIRTNLPFILAALANADLTALPIVLAALATIRAETAGFEPISEGRSIYNTSPNGQPFDLYDNRKDLGNQGPPDGADFKGRGYFQLTGRANYTRFGPTVGVDLVAAPDQANDPDVAARLLAQFMLSKQKTIATALAKGDLAAARRAVNGGSHGLDAFTSAYETGRALLA